MLPETGLVLLRSTEISVGVSLAEAKRHAGAEVVERATFEPHRTTTGGESGGGNVVDGAAERGGAEGKRVAATPDVDVVRRQRIDCLHVEAAIG